jgi:biofilm PGA synthesis N-glycosyltransferase PgaC
MPSLLLIYVNYVLSIVWSFAMIFGLLIGLAAFFGWTSSAIVAGVSLVPAWWGAVLAVTYLAQAATSHLVERRYEPDILKSLFWIVWYPLAFWMIATLSTLRAIPKVLFRKGEVKGTWISPDRGFRAQ